MAQATVRLAPFAQAKETVSAHHLSSLIVFDQS